MEMVVTATLRPVEEDEGRLICCHVEQWDNSQPRQSLATVEKVNTKRGEIFHRVFLQMTPGLNVLFGPRNLNIKQDHKNGSHLVWVRFQSNPSPDNVTFILERTDCEEETRQETCQPVTLVSGTGDKNFNATSLLDKVSTSNYNKAKNCIFSFLSIVK